MVGLAQGALDVAIPYTKERQQFNSRIYDFQVGEINIVHHIEKHRYSYSF